MDKIIDLAGAVSQIKAGSLVTLSGFQLSRAPMALLFELIRQNKRDLHIITPPNPLALDMLVAANLVSSAEFGYNGFQYEHGFVIPPNWRRAIESNSIEWKESDVYYIIQALRAASMNIPFIPVAVNDDSQYAGHLELKEATNPFNSKSVKVVQAVSPDVALIHAQKADKRGNIFIADPITDEFIIRASKKVIVSVEEIVPTCPQVTIPYFLIEHIIYEPYGAFPTACFGYYCQCSRHIQHYIECSKENKVEEYLNDFVLSKKNHMEFLSYAKERDLFF
jgi:glutaconate CoA-transferase subunit A